MNDLGNISAATFKPWFSLVNNGFGHHLSRWRKTISVSNKCFDLNAKSLLMNNTDSLQCSLLNFAHLDHGWQLTCGRSKQATPTRGVRVRASKARKAGTGENQREGMRLVRRFSRNKRLIGGVLLFLSSLVFIWTFFRSTAVDQPLGGNDVFYDDNHAHLFVVDHAKPYQRAVEDPVEFIPNRKRTLKTYYGVVQVKDLLFVPINPLKKSQSLLPRLPKKQDFDKPLIDMGLGSRSQGGRGLAPLMPHPNSNASKLYSMLQQLQKKREEGRGVNNKESAGRGQFLNSEKMLALRAQMQARESQSMKNDVKDSYFQKGLEVLKTLTNNTRCKKQMCTDFLTSYDLSHYRSCMKKAKIRYNKESPYSKCNFIDGTVRDAVALVSHPGSGHLWVRQLLQMSTGVCTGGIECDVKLRRSGFPGENLRSGVVLVVNTHQTQPTWTRVQDDESIRFNGSIDIPVFGSAILLVRDPFDALADLWHYVNGRGMVSGKR